MSNSHQSSRTNGPDVREHPVLKRDWTFSKQPRAKYAKGILLTGPNSFIGVFVLSELVARYPGDIHCLIRAESIDHAAERIQSAASAWGLEPIDIGRVHLHLGACTQPRWGLSEETYQTLLGETGAVVHMALKARYDLPFSYFNDVWVPELARMVEICGDARHPAGLR